MEKTINVKQFGIIVFFVAIATKIFMLPAIILGISGRDSYLTLLVYFVMEILIMVMVIKIDKKHPTKSLYELLQSGFGKIFSRMILAVIVIFYIFKMTVMISEMKIFFTVTATENLSWLLCVLPFLAVLGIMSLKSLRSLGRVCEITIPVVFTSLVVMGLIMSGNTKFTNILPFLENGIKNNWHSFITLPLWLSDFSILTIFIGKIEHRKKIMTTSIILCVIAFLMVLYFNIVMYAAYSYTPKLLDYGHNITNMVLYETGTYNYGRFDLLMFAVWMVGVFIHVALLFYAVCRHMTYMFRIKNNYITAIINIVVLFVLIIHVFPDDQLLYSLSTSVFNYFALASEFLFPALLFVRSLTGKKFGKKGRRLLNEA